MFAFITKSARGLHYNVKQSSRRTFIILVRTICRCCDETAVAAPSRSNPSACATVRELSNYNVLPSQRLCFLFEGPKNCLRQAFSARVKPICVLGDNVLVLFVSRNDVKEKIMRCICQKRICICRKSCFLYGRYVESIS